MLCEISRGQIWRPGQYNHGLYKLALGKLKIIFLVGKELKKLVDTRVEGKCGSLVEYFRYLTCTDKQSGPWLCVPKRETQNGSAFVSTSSMTYDEICQKLPIHVGLNLSYSTLDHDSISLLLLGTFIFDS